MDRVDPDRHFSDPRSDHNLLVAETSPGDSVAEFSSVFAISIHKKEKTKRR
jgi:hypothetical protein